MIYDVAVNVAGRSVIVSVDEFCPQYGYSWEAVLCDDTHQTEWAARSVLAEDYYESERAALLAGVAYVYDNWTDIV